MQLRSERSWFTATRITATSRSEQKMGSSAIITASIAAFIRSLPFTENSDPENLNSGVNEKIDFFREQIRNFADHIAAKKINQRVALRCAENEPGCAQGGSKIDNRICRGRTNGVSEQWLMISGLLLRFIENPAGFFVVL